MPIYKSILKYGHENFIFQIIEYCEPDMTIKREQYYLDKFDFEYNVLANANSIAGYKHTAETLEKMKGRQNLLGYKHSQETIENLRDINIGKIHSEEAKKIMRNTWAERKLKTNSLKAEIDLLIEDKGNKAKKEGKKVVVTNIENNVSIEYNSITEAASVLNLTRVTLRKYIKNKEVFTILKENENSSGLINEKYLITIKYET